MENKELEKLSYKQLFGYTIGAIPASLLAFIFYLKYIEFFYNDLGLLPIFFIIEQIIYMTVNALNDPLMGQLSDRTNREKWGMRKIILRFGFIKTIGMFIIFILILIPTLESLSIPLLWIAFIISMIFGGYGVFGAPLMFLSADEDEVNHGTRREGMLLGMSALFTKPAQSLGPIIATLILVYFGYVQGSDTQSPSALFGIKILFLLVPPLMVAISLIFIYFYPLHGEKLKEMQQKLEKIHKEKREKSQII